MSEEYLMENQKELLSEFEDDLFSFIDVPYFLYGDEIGEKQKSLYIDEVAKIKKYYRCYENGVNFIPEGSNGDYVPSDLRYKKSAMILNKEARFLFSNPPTFKINPDDVDGKYKDQNTIIQNFLDNVFEKNEFKGNLLKALKDCFIGKRIAIVLNFNSDYGISITFLNSLEFLYEISDRGGSKEIIKFITFYNMNDSDELSEQRWFKKVYTKEIGGVYLKEEIFSGNGNLIDTITKKQKIKFSYIPAVVVLNDGLTGDLKGKSEIASLLEYEKNYSKLANADMDSERKSMNPIRYTIDASAASTKKLPISPGSYWDLQSDEERSGERAAKVGIIEANMNYSSPLKITLDRIENEMFASLDVPNINSEQLAGVITSGKTIKALYWGLVVRCDEKMLAWEPQLKKIAYMIIEGAILYPNCISRYTDEKIPKIPLKILVENNYPLPEDIQEEKTMDIAEVEAKVRSKKSYIKKWRELGDKGAEEEIEQIRVEQEMLENSFIGNMMNSETEEEQDTDVEEKDESVDDKGKGDKDKK